MSIYDLLNLYSQQGQGQWQQPANNNERRGLSSNLMGDYSPQPRYGQQNANPWQEQLMSQLFQQPETAKRDKPTTGRK